MPINEEQMFDRVEDEYVKALAEGRDPQIEDIIRGALQQGNFLPAEVRVMRDALKTTLGHHGASMSEDQRASFAHMISIMTRVSICFQEIQGTGIKMMEKAQSDRPVAKAIRSTARELLRPLWRV